MTLEDDDCPICREPLRDRRDVINTDDARHLFHVECLLPLYTRDKNFPCPICRGRVNPDTLTVVNHRELANQLREWYYVRIPNPDGQIYRRLFTNKAATGFYCDPLLVSDDDPDPWFINIRDNGQRISRHFMTDPRPWPRDGPRHADQLALERAYDRQQHENAEYIRYYQHYYAPWSREDHPVFGQTVLRRLFGR
jgi:hypothetical protein